MQFNVSKYIILYSGFCLYYISCEIETFINTILSLLHLDHKLSLSVFCTRMMRCAEIVGPNLPLRLVIRPRLAVPPGGFLVRTTHAGVCHTDLHYIKDKWDLGQGMTRHFSEAISM